MKDELQKLIKENSKLRMKVRELEYLLPNFSNDDLNKTKNLILDFCCDLYWEFYPSTMSTTFSENYLDITGWNKLVYDFNEIKSMVHPDDIIIFNKNLLDVINGKIEHFNYEFRWKNSDGKYLWINNRCIALRDSTLEKNYIFGISNNVTNQRKKEEMLQEELLKNKLLLNTMTDLMWEYDIYSDSFSLDEKILSSIGIKNKSVFVQAMKQTVKSSLIELAAIAHKPKRINIANSDASREKWYELILYPLKNSKEEYYKLIGTLKNIDDRIREEILLKQDASIDPLTQIHNRRAGSEYLMQIFKDYKYNDNNYIILFLDLDNFKVINDTYSHAAGDLVLQSFTKYCEETISNLNGKIIRWGGEEFVATFPSQGPTADERIVKNLCKQIARIAVEWNDYIIHFTVSIGATKFKINDVSFNDAIKRADEGMYYVKKNNKNNTYWL